MLVRCLMGRLLYLCYLFPKLGWWNANEMCFSGIRVREKAKREKTFDVLRLFLHFIKE